MFAVRITALLLVVVGASACSAPMEPEKAPDRVVTLESEGGGSVKAPAPARTFPGCVTEQYDASGHLSQWNREVIDEGGHVVARGWGDVGASSSSMLFTYDDQGRIRTTSSGEQRSTFVYDGAELRVESTYGGVTTAKRYRLDDRGLLTYAYSEGATLHWFDEARPLDYAAGALQRSWTWGDDGFLRDFGETWESYHCSRQFSWTEAEHSVSFVTHDDVGSETWSGEYSFDAEARMIHAVVGDGPATTWRYEDGWSIATVAGGPSSLRTSAACHQPPTRKELPNVFAGAVAPPPIEPRPTHVPRVGPMPYPPSYCLPPFD